MEPRTENSRANRVERLLYVCASAAVTTGILQWAEGHYLKALLAASLFLVVVPWLGKRWINRSQR
jgi:hypothetical protein